jgi:acetyl esterase/lipase
MERLLIGVSLGCFLAAAGDTTTTSDTRPRLERTQLEAAHAARLGFARQRAQLPDHGLWIDVRAAFVRLPEGAVGPAQASRLVAAARRAGVRIVLPVAPGPTSLASWRGLRDGVLLIPGVETADGMICLPQNAGDGPTSSAAEGGLRFLTAVGRGGDGATQAVAGIEIGGRADPKAVGGATLALLEAVTRSRPAPADWRGFPTEVFGGAVAARPDLLERWETELRTRPLTGIAVVDLPPGDGWAGLPADAWDGVMGSVSTHLRVTEISESAVRVALAEGRAYVAHDWLCDPTGFVFGAVNNLGVFPEGDSAPLAGKTRAMALCPVPARIKLIHNGRVIHETTGTNLTHDIGDFGAYRVEAWLSVGGEDRPWLFSNPIRLRAPTITDMRLPSNELAAHAEVTRDLTYVSGKPEDEAKHKLDVYRPKGATQAPVFFFVHGGAWKYGDRNQYTPLGNRYTREGFVTVVPSYRLAPKSPFPAQIEDVAAAFAWTVQHATEFGGDTNRLFIGGHSAGGHLSALLALDRRHLDAARALPVPIRGVLALSGAYDLTGIDAASEVFGKDPAARRAASPVVHVRPDAPPFLVTYCQWDYFSLPAQARQLDAALRKVGVASKLVYVPGQNHISEMLNVGAPNDPTVTAAVAFMRP